jgi:hypothetical protein
MFVKLCRNVNINKYIDFQWEALNKIDKRQQQINKLSH